MLDVGIEKMIGWEFRIKLGEYKMGGWGGISRDGINIEYKVIFY